MKITLGLVPLVSTSVRVGELDIQSEDADPETINAALNFGRALYKDGDFSELKEVLRALLSVQDVQGLHGLQLRWLYASALRDAENATLDDLVEAVETLDDVSQKWRRMLGPQHPDYPAVENALNRTRKALAQARARASK